MRFFPPAILPLVLAASLLAAPPPAPGTTVLGQSGDIAVTTDEIRETLAGLEAGQEEKLARDPAALAQYVRAILVQRLVLKEAAEKKIDQDPAVVARLVRARETALAEAFLDSVSTPPAGYPAEDEIKAAYEGAKSSLVIPRSHRLAQIFVALPKEESKEALAKAEAKVAEIGRKLKTRDADFAKTARETSEETATAANGGEIGWVAENQIQPAIRGRLAKPSPAEPVKLPDGWHFIKVLDSREPSTPTLEQVKPQLAARLRAERARQLRQEFVAALVQKNPPAINEIELIKLVPGGNP